MTKMITIFRQALLIAAMVFGLGCLASLSFAATVQDTVIDDVTREFSLDSTTPPATAVFTQAGAQTGVVAQPTTPPSPPPNPVSPPPSSTAPTAVPPATCGQLLPYFGLQAGPGAVCLCPANNLAAVANPVCTCSNGVFGPPCQTQCSTVLPATQTAAGANQTCSCPGPVMAAVQTVSPVGSCTTPGSCFFDTAYLPYQGMNWIYGLANNNVPNGANNIMQSTVTNSGTTPIQATVYVVADDAASVTMDGTQIASYSDGGAGLNGWQTYPATGGVVSEPISIPPGTHTIQLSVTNYCAVCGPTGNPSQATIGIVGSNGTVLLNGDSTWKYIVSQGSSTPTCATNCDGIMAGTPAYQSNSFQVCACPSGGSSVATPSCTPTCGAQLTTAQIAAGSGQVCSCPNGDASVGAPSCTATCGSLLGTASYPSTNCSCQSGVSSTTTPSCAQTCTNELATYQTVAGASMTCSCPTGSAYALPVCATNCAGKIASLQGQFGSGYTCTCTNPQSLTETPTCGQSCGSIVAAYQITAGANTICSCPSGATSLTQPTCVQSCGSQLSAAQTQYGSSYVCSCPNGSMSGGAPSCALSCGAMLVNQSTYATNQYQVCTCPNGATSTTTPTCVDTCAGQVAASQAAAGSNYSCSCPTAIGTTGSTTLQGAPWFNAGFWTDPSASWIYSGSTPIVQDGSTQSLQTTWTNTGTLAIPATLSVAMADAGTVLVDGAVTVFYSNQAPATLATGGVSTTTVTLSPGTHTIQVIFHSNCATCAPYSDPSAAMLSMSSGGTMLVDSSSAWTLSSATNSNPACAMNCGGYLATDAAFSSNVNQICACPSGGSSLSLPTCQPTCGAQLTTSQTQAGSNYTCSCPNGSSNPGTPSCSMDCAGVLATNPTYGTNSNQVCSCANPTAITNPTCTPTCGSQLSAFQSSYGPNYVCSCPSGNTNVGTPSCVLDYQPIATYSCLSGYTLSGTTCYGTVATTTSVAATATTTAVQNAPYWIHPLAMAGALSCAPDHIGTIISWSNSYGGPIQCEYNSTTGGLISGHAGCGTAWYPVAGPSPSNPVALFAVSLYYHTVYASFAACSYTTTTTYSCQPGYTLSGTTCTVTTTAQTPQPATTTLTCPYGGSVTGTMCQ